jgi:hypothetical protein
MYISHINNVIQQVEELEWLCRKESKGLTKSEYWTWLATITTQDDDGHDVVTYPSEDFTIVECTDENVQVRLIQLDDYINLSPRKPAYNIKYYVSKRDSEIVDVEAHTIAAHTDEDGNDVAEEDVATTYVQTHFIGDDTAKAARLLADKWVNVRRDRDDRLAVTDYLALSDHTLSGDMETYREALRDVPSQSDPDNISWPVKPS